MENRNIAAIPLLTAEELYALEGEARRMRSVAVARAVANAVTALKDLFSKTPQGVRHA